MGESSCHPALLLEDVLEAMFKIMPFEELKECRLICRNWEEASRKFVKRRSQLRFIGSTQRNLALWEFLRQDFHFFIPSKLKIGVISDFQWRAENPSVDKELENHDEDDKGLEDIYGILGRHSFEELEIHGFDNCKYTGIPEHLLKMLGHVSTSNSPQCFIPGTEHQTLDICPLLTKLTIEQDAPEWLRNRIFSACPNLLEINANSFCRLTVLEKSPGGLRKITGLYCSTQQELEILKRKSGNLTELSLTVEERPRESVLEFVQSKKESLALLKLRFQFLEIPATLRFGDGFNHLIKLQLEIGNHSHAGVQILLDICFSRDTPQLKYFKLEIFAKDQNWKDMLAYRSNIAKGGRVIPLRTLTYLDLSMGRRVDRECADYLRQLFPSLTSFNIKRPTEDFLRGLWQMENLVELEIDLTIENDKRYYQNIEDLGVALFGTPEVEESILNLKKLRYLAISKCYWSRNRNVIPDEAVRNGFGNIKRLTVLKLPFLKMSPEGSEFLRANLPYLKKLELGWMFIPPWMAEFIKQYPNVLDGIM